MLHKVTHCTGCVSIFVAMKSPAAVWLRENLFDGPFNTALTILAAAGIVAIAWPLGEWALAAARWTGVAEDCRAAEGACWAVVGEKYRWVLLGRYPFDEQWRPVAAMLILMAAIGVSLDRRRWRRSLLAVWAAAGALFYWLMQGGALGLEFTPVELWGGLPLTLMLSVVGIAAAFPLSVVLALGRRSRLPAIRILCVGYIELIRGVPLISLLFMATLMLPLFLPEGIDLNQLICAQVAMILFAAAYFAEVVRGGLQAIPRGQYEAADALGLSYAQSMRKIVLPQALTHVIPPLANTCIGIFKDTSLVVLVGLFDLLGAAKAALTDPAWHGFPAEVYLFAAAVYFAFCYGMSLYSRRLEVELRQGARR